MPGPMSKPILGKTKTPRHSGPHGTEECGRGKVCRHLPSKRARKIAAGKTRIGRLERPTKR